MIQNENDPQRELCELAGALKRILREEEGSGCCIGGDRHHAPQSEKITVSRRPVEGESQISPAYSTLSLTAIQDELGNCRRCGLSQGRNNIVFGEGNPHADLVFVGEAPGEQEDRQGKPFVGRAGQLLTKIIEAMGFTRQDVYICNILKCRPPGNRNPRPEEIAACEPFLKKQLEALAPKVICALGSFAAKTLLRKEVPITLLRGKFHFYQGINLMPTYHPAYLLRNPGAKKQVWDDVQIIMKYLKDRD